MLPILFIFLAALFKSIADTLEHHFSVSVFRRLNPHWWDPDISYSYVKFLPMTKYRPDAWHLSNSGLLWAMIMVAVTKDSQWVFHLKWPWYINLGILGGEFVLIFNLFYNKIFRK